MRGKRNDKRLTDALRKVLMEPAPGHGPDRNLDLAVRALVKEAREGNLEALKLCFDRLEGKPDQHTTKDVNLEIGTAHLEALRTITAKPIPVIEHRETENPETTTGNGETANGTTKTVSGVEAGLAHTTLPPSRGT